jgi:hypothetical protein
MVLADIAVLLIPLWILLGLLVLFGILALLARVQNGRYLRPIVNLIAKVPLFRKGLQKASNAALEKSNPELASAMKKMQRHGTRLNDPQQAQRAMSQLTRDERRAILELQQQQQEQGVGPTPEQMNRQMRRRMEKAQKNAKRR